MSATMIASMQSLKNIADQWLEETVERLAAKYNFNKDEALAFLRENEEREETQTETKPKTKKDSFHHN